MQPLQVLNYNDQSIRQTVNEDGEVLFCAYDVAKALGYRDALDILRNLDEDERPQMVRALDSKNELREMPFVNEYQIYGILMMLNTERTKPFRRWVTHEVLPSIRKYGYYINAQMTEDQLEKMKEKVKSLMPYKRKVDHQLSLASDWRYENSDSKLMIINIRTGKRSTLWKLTADVKKFLESKSLLKRGKIFDDWKLYHNFNEYCRKLIEDEGFEI